MTKRSPPAFPARFERCPFEHGGIRRQVLRGEKQGPAVILIHELPGVTSQTVALADILERSGFTVVLPVLLDRPRTKASLSRQVRNGLRICIAREFAAWARHQTSPIVQWLNALAQRETTRASYPEYGVIGMCFSGSFALAMAARTNVAAAVVSQPSLPFAVPGLRVDLGLSERDRHDLRGRAAEGFRVRALRFQRDPISPGARQRELARTLANADVVEVPTCNPFRHSVLTEGLHADPDTDVGRALAETIDYLLRRLIDSPGPTGSTSGTDARRGSGAGC